LRKIIAGHTDDWSSNLRSGWTRFILSLLFRNPESVATTRSTILEIWDYAIKGLQADYAKRRQPGGPTTFEEFYAKHVLPHAAHVDAANFLAELIDNNRVGTTVFEMNWSRIDLSTSSHQLAHVGQAH
jgi:hypothetical protein